MFFFVSPFRLNLLLHDGQIEESHQSQPDPQVAQEPNQEAIFQEAHQDERSKFWISSTVGIWISLLVRHSGHELRFNKLVQVDYVGK